MALAVFAVGLIVFCAMWLVTASRNRDLLAKNEQLIDQVASLQTERDSAVSRNEDLRGDLDGASRQLARCDDALDAAEGTVQLMSEILDISGDAIDAASTWNASRLESLTRDVEQLKPSIDRSASDYRAAAGDCRAGT
ncbi:hypothetical protein FDO65_14035 [Nakamurella flava]|uniref:Uncharacterized protein n=1 Tax=Nakamurella flava TaxID=2576308 RepID=A0A4U6QEZ7_9ACTN|nr:hypothetical protein [Nakamurella flava]TKV58641.1 hypothetical protein FDO65_14035 [Nakamurella flava]